MMSNIIDFKTIILIIIFWFCWCYNLGLFKKKLEAEDKPNGYYFTDGTLDEKAEDCYFVIGILFVVAIVIGIDNIQSIIQAIVFPEKTILEFMTSYIK